MRNPDLGNVETTAASTPYWHHCFGVAMKLVVWGVPPDHFGPGGSKLGACRAVARLAEHAHLQGLAHGARGDPESGRRWG